MASSVNETAIAKAKDRAKTDAHGDKVVISNLMSHPMGRRWIWVQLAECHVFHEVFNSSPGGNAKMCFAEGQRSRGLQLLDKVTRYSPNNYIEMLRENNPNNQEEDEDDRPVSE